MAGVGNIREILSKEKYEKQGFEVLGQGWPDFLLFDKKTKTAIFLEVKSHKDYIHPEQRRMHEILRELGLTVRVDWIGKIKNTLKRPHIKVAFPKDLVDRELSGETIVLTRELLEKGKSRYGAWGFVQLKLLGVNFPLKKGWKHRLKGKEIPVEWYNKFVELRDAHLRSTKQSQASI